MTAVILIIKNIYGYLYAHKRTVAILAAILLIAILSILFIKWLTKPTVKLDEKQLQEVHEAIESKERQKMEDVFVKVEASQAEIDANVANSKAEVINAQQEARKQVKAMSDQELAAYLESLK